MRLLRIFFLMFFLTLVLNNVSAQSYVLTPIPVDVSNDLVENNKKSGKGRIVMVNCYDEAYYIDIVSKSNGNRYTLRSCAKDDIITGGHAHTYAYFLEAGDYYVLSTTAAYPVTFNGRPLHEDDDFTVLLNGNYIYFKEP